MFRYINKNISPIIVILLAEVLRLAKISLIIGSKTLFFTATNCCSPLLGKYGGLSTSFLYYAARTLFKLFITSSASLFMLVYHIPTFCASWYMSLLTNHRKLSALFPLICMILFVVHPTGFKAAAYASLWLVPIIYSLGKFHNLFFECFSTTLVAHAVGSVLWLYTSPMTSALWLGLIPVACAERLLFAVGMVFCIKAWESIRTLSFARGKVFAS